MAKKNVIVEEEVRPSLPQTHEITVAQALEMHGNDAHIHWRPDGTLNPQDPGSDRAIQID